MRQLLLVMSEPVEGEDEAFHDWYENTHLDEVLASTGWKTAQRFALADEQGLSCPRRFLALYEIENDDPNAVLPHLAATRSQRLQSRAIDRAGAGAWVFSPTGPKHYRTAGDDSPDE